MSVEGVDVSQTNGSVDWSKVAGAGKKFAICKVSEGDWHDPTFTRERVAEIRQHDMIAGGYVFLRPRPGRTGAEEVRGFFWPSATACGLWHADHGRVLDLRPVLDVERSEYNLALARGRQATTAYIESAIEAVLELTHGRHPIIYAGSLWRDELRPGKDFDCQLWYPEYGVSAPRKVPPPWTQPKLWQFTETGQVAGVHGHVDINRYLGPSMKAFQHELCI